MTIKIQHTSAVSVFVRYCDIDEMLFYSISSLFCCRCVLEGGRGNTGFFHLAYTLHFTLLSSCPHRTFSTLSVTLVYHTRAWDLCAALHSSSADGKNVTRISITESLWGRTWLMEANAINFFFFQHLFNMLRWLLKLQIGGVQEKAEVVAALGYLSREKFQWRYCLSSP